MTIQELRNNLSGLPDDAEVILSGHSDISGKTIDYYVDHVYFDNDSNELVIEGEFSI